MVIYSVDKGGCVIQAPKQLQNRFCKNPQNKEVIYKLNKERLKAFLQEYKMLYSCTPSMTVVMQLCKKLGHTKKFRWCGNLTEKRNILLLAYCKRNF